MEQLQDPVVDAATSLGGGSSSMVTLANVSDAKAVEVRADGIYETSNQQEVMTSALSPQASTSSSVSSSAPSKKADVTYEEPVVVAHASPPDELKPTEVLETAYSSFDDVEVQEPQATSAGAVEHHVASESGNPIAIEQAPAEELQNTASPPLSTRAPEATSSSGEPPTSAPATASHDTKAKHDNLQNESCAVDAPMLSKVQDFLIEKIQENQLSSHAQEILEFVALHLNDKQKKVHLPSLIQRIVAHFNHDAQANGREDASVDVQSSICLLEQTFLTFGRVSPLQDMYTAEEEDMLDQLGGAQRSERRVSPTNQQQVARP